jgi:hypothetical protein
VLLEDRIARLVDREQVWVDGVALGVPYTFGRFETNLHKVSFFVSFGGFAENPERTIDRKISRSIKSRRRLPIAADAIGAPLPHMRYWCAIAMPVTKGSERD